MSKERPAIFQQQLTDAFNGLAAEGLKALSVHDAGLVGQLSHVCFKFKDQSSYRRYVAAARQVGEVFTKEFKGKEISWCKLSVPLEKEGLFLTWVEMVEPRTEKNGFDGVVSLGYCVPDLDDTLKLPSSRNGVFFRYQPRHVHP